MSKSKIFFFFCLSFILGIFLNSLLFLAQFLILGFLILAVIFIFLLLPYKKLVLIDFCLIFLILGMWHHGQADLRVRDNQLRNFNDLEQKAVLIGLVVEEPDILENKQRLTIGPLKIFLNDKEYSRKDWGRVLVTYKKFPQYQYGDKLEIKGKLEAPGAFQGFNYQNYLARKGIYSVIHWSEIQLLERGNYRGLFSRVYAKILSFKSKLRESIYQNLSPAQSSILGAMILGDKRRMPSELKGKLNIAGVRHITAVSGLHITILSGVLMSFLLALGFYRSQAFYFSIILIFLFIVMTGLQASAVRAGIMGGLYLWAKKIGRTSSSSRAIVMVAAFMLVLNPLLLLYDVGFQLSFLAVMGIIYLGPFFRRLFKFIPEKINNFRDILVMTVSAYLFTLPILIYNFGQISLVAFLTNILILPIVPFVMVLGFCLGLLGILGDLAILESLRVFGSIVLSLPTWILLTYLLAVVNFFSQPWAVKTIKNVHWIWLIISYLILGFLAWYLNRRKKIDFLP